MRGFDRQLPNPTRERDWKSWAEKLYQHLLADTPAKSKADPTPVLLSHKIGSGNTQERAAVDGILMYDPVLKSVVVSKAKGAGGYKWERIETRQRDVGVDSVAATSAGTLITFSEPFETLPCVVVTPYMTAPADNVAYSVMITELTVSNFRVRLNEIDSAYGSPVRLVAGTVAWEATEL